ncbi:MAG: hypothetical protein Kow0045_15080 [Albidovulum sp.]
MKPLRRDRRPRRRAHRIEIADHGFGNKTLGHCHIRAAICCYKIGSEPQRGADLGPRGEAGSDERDRAGTPDDWVRHGVSGNELGGVTWDRPKKSSNLPVFIHGPAPS